MRIVSYNVNGLRAAEKKGFYEKTFALGPDALFIQETKLSDSLKPREVDGYHLYFSNSKERKGYSGTACYLKKEPLSIHYGLHKGEYDDEGRLLTAEFPSYFLVGAYVPNSGEGLKRLPYRMEFEDRLREYLLSLDKRKPVIYCGDLNVAHNPIDLKNPKSNEGNAGYTKEEREKMDQLLGSGFIDAYRFLYPEGKDYSWWSYRFKAKERDAGWRIDCFIISERLKGALLSSHMEREFDCSDHCPIVLDIDL